MIDRMGKPRFTIEERADRFQRRYTGPWRTVRHELGPVVIEHRYRRRTHIDFVRLSVAGHDLFTHVLWRGVFLPRAVPFLRWFARRLGDSG